VDVDGNASEGPEVEIQGTVPVADEHLARIRIALEGVVMEPRGTGGRSRVPGVRVAGKTGTAQVVALEHTEDLDEDEVTIRHRDHAWFVAYAPADAPEIVVVALVEHGGHGGSAAAPIVQKVLAEYFGETAGAVPPAPAAPAAPVAPPAESPEASPPGPAPELPEGAPADPPEPPRVTAAVPGPREPGGADLAGN
jgi:penicillin-binding protein 2